METSSPSSRTIITSTPMTWRNCRSDSLQQVQECRVQALYIRIIRPPLYIAMGLQGGPQHLPILGTFLQHRLQQLQSNHSIPTSIKIIYHHWEQHTITNLHTLRHPKHHQLGRSQFRFALEPRQSIMIIKDLQQDGCVYTL